MTSQMTSQMTLVTLGLFLVITFAPGGQGCFPVDTVFHHITLWSQEVKKSDRILFAIAQESNDVMTVKEESKYKTREFRLTCLEGFGQHRYLVQIEEETKRTKFGCVRFTSLSAQVVQAAYTKRKPNRDKVNCETDTYKDELGIMIAYYKMSPQACPFIGGFQLRMHEGQFISAHCLDSVKTYNPRFEFSCSGDHVIADFGNDCAPVLRGENDVEYKQPFAHFQCVGSWNESGKKSAVLLQMKNDPLVFWCMHYETVDNTEGEIWDINVVFNGKCSSSHHGDDDDVMYGRMAKYVPTSDKRCYDATYTKKCKYHSKTCFDSHECPAECKRCNSEIAKRECGFKEQVLGHWNGHGLDLEVKRHGFKVTGFGIFSCYGKEGQSSSDDDIFQVVRNDANSSCLPLYACAKVSSPAHGVLNYFLRPAKLNQTRGEPLSCVENPHEYGSIVPMQEQKTITVLNEKMLKRVPCDIDREMLFPSGQGQCKFVLKACSGSCDTLHGDYDASSCGNDTAFSLDHEHVCHASFVLPENDGIRIRITSSVQNANFLCWMFTSNTLFITDPKHCNVDGVNRIFQDENSLRLYGPLLGISMPVNERVVGPGGEAPSVLVPKVVLLVSFLLFIVFTEL